MDAKTKWNSKYKNRLETETLPTVNPRLQQMSSYLKGGGKALDLACGLGTNSLLLAEQGYTVDALDVSDVAIEHLKKEARLRNFPVKTQLCDLTNIEEVKLEENTYDLVVISYYLDRSIYPFIKSLLKEKGYFFMETFYLSSRNNNKKISDQYKLNSQELLTIFKDWQVLYYEENEEEGRQTIFVRNNNLS
ncbi:SAM-dependent methyltransferase [Evansella vedderi]|uniref:SAM-dependent methyltransferase n=1 Tax=Evansella vedderi TaxID=38282 RepID=A0ABU0A4U9_9BACI|nr:class I SAM-dependent methyltransferase [Evansella vedderi]MDQ0258057.1 SAM-dependent methyltransferase [Evansella vedderi]